MIIGTFLENGLEASLSSRTNIVDVWKERTLWTFEKGIFQFFASFWVTKLEPFSGKARKCCENFLHKVCFVGSFLENTFPSLFHHSRQSLLEFWIFPMFWIFSFEYSTAGNVMFYLWNAWNRFYGMIFFVCLWTI